MSIYMDRHYLKNATQHALAAAHEKDLNLQEKYGIKMLTYWFDEDRGTAFCLVDAPDEEALHKLHDEAHGSVPNEIIPVDPVAVEAFLGRIEDPVAPGGAPADPSESTIDAAFRTIMYTDLEDSTLMTTRLGDTKAIHFLRIHNALIRRALKSNGGREVKNTGDGFMVSFSSTSDAINCSIDIQKFLAAYNDKNSEVPIRVRIGLSAGEPVEENGDLFGTSVQLSARLCDHAEPGSIIVAQIVKDECGPETFEFLERGNLTPKGFLEPVPIYEIEWSF